MWENKDVLESLDRALEEAASGNLSDSPEDLEDIFAFAESLDD